MQAASHTGIATGGAGQATGAPPGWKLYSAGCWRCCRSGAHAGSATATVVPNMPASASRMCSSLWCGRPEAFRAGAGAGLLAAAVLSGALDANSCLKL
jgi:hypothetical protein